MKTHAHAIQYTQYFLLFSSFFIFFSRIYDLDYHQPFLKIDHEKHKTLPEAEQLSLLNKYLMSLGEKKRDNYRKICEQLGNEVKPHEFLEMVIDLKKCQKSEHRLKDFPSLDKIEDLLELVKNSDYGLLERKTVEMIVKIYETLQPTKMVFGGPEVDTKEFQKRYESEGMKTEL